MSTQTQDNSDAVMQDSSGAVTIANALKMAFIGLCLLFAGCDKAHTKCVDGKYYIKWTNDGQYILEKGTECLNEQAN